MFMGVSQHAEFDFDVRFARGDAHMLHPENTPEFNLKVALSPPGVLLVIYDDRQQKKTLKSCVYCDRREPLYRMKGKNVRPAGRPAVTLCNGPCHAPLGEGCESGVGGR